MVKTAAPISNLVFDGLRCLGMDRVTREHLDDLRKTLLASDRQRLLEDLPMAPGWMHPLVRQIGGSSERSEP